jgi:hypothetical protein
VRIADDSFAFRVQLPAQPMHINGLPVKAVDVLARYPKVPQASPRPRFKARDFTHAQGDFNCVLDIDHVACGDAGQEPTLARHIGRPEAADARSFDAGDVRHSVPTSEHALCETRQRFFSVLPNSRGRTILSQDFSAICSFSSASMLDDHTDCVNTLQSQYPADLDRRWPRRLLRDDDSERISALPGNQPLKGGARFSIHAVIVNDGRPRG